jgi:hypothetical protein
MPRLHLMALPAFARLQHPPSSLELPRCSSLDKRCSRPVGFRVGPHYENKTSQDLAFFRLQTEHRLRHIRPPLASQRDNLISMNSLPRRCSKSISLMILGVCLLDAGCGPPTVWEAAVRSPDGRRVAMARTVQNGGFGNAWIVTTVSLKYANSSEPPTEVLGFSCDGPVPRPYTLDNVANAGGTIDLTMNWVTPSHLDVTYDGRRRGSLEFQAVKWSGVEISVRDVMSEPTNNKDSK